MGRVLIMETLENVQQAFAEQGVDLTMDELIQWGEIIKWKCEEGKLTEDSLDEVAGGFSMSIIGRPIIKLPPIILGVPPCRPIPWIKWIIK